MSGGCREYRERVYRDVGVGNRGREVIEMEYGVERSEVGKVQRRCAGGKGR